MGLLYTSRALSSALRWSPDRAASTALRLVLSMARAGAARLLIITAARAIDTLRMISLP